MGQYAALFRFLLRLKRACAELDGAWAALRGFGRARATDPSLDPGGRRALWHLRHRMAHLVGNLQVYMQVLLAVLTLSQIGPQVFWPTVQYSTSRVHHRSHAGHRQVLSLGHLITACWLRPLLATGCRPMHHALMQLRSARQHSTCMPSCEGENFPGLHAAQHASCRQGCSQSPRCLHGAGGCD